MNELCAQVRASLHAHRRARHLQQDDIAARLNLTQSAISNIESGHGDIGLRTLHRYARALGLRPVVTFVPEDEGTSQDDGTTAAVGAYAHASTHRRAGPTLYGSRGRSGMNEHRE